MFLTKSSRNFLKSVGGARFLLFMAALVGMIFLSVSGISRAQSQPKAQQLSSKAGEAYIKVIYPGKNEVWEKGKRYTIRWESKGIRGNVKIVLVGEDVNRSGELKTEGLREMAKAREVKSFEIARNTYNSGSFSYVIAANLPDGIYKVQIMTIDGSIKGESEGAITIRGQKPVSAKVMTGTQAPQGAAAPPAKTAPSAGATPSAGAAAATGKTASTAAASTKGATPSVAVAGKTPTAAAKIVRQDIAAMKASDAELKNFNFQKSAVSAPNYKIGGHSTTGGTSVGTIEIFTPKDGDTWEAGKEYGISWKSAGLSGDVKIVLERITIHAGGTSSSEEYPIVDRTANTGSYRFRVPMNWVQDPHGYHVRVKTLDGKMSGKSRGAIILPALPPPVDLECQIVDAQVKSQTKEYVFYADKERYLEFNVLFRNKGSRSPITINTVLVRIIKEPEDVVCMQEEWGLGGIYHNDWYKLPEPRKFNIQSWKEYVGGHVNLWEGAYRIEVELDPQNQVGEYEELRGDNKAVKKWVIKLKKGKGW